MAKKVVVIILLAIALAAFLILRPFLFAKQPEPSILDRLPDDEFIGRVNVLSFARESQKITEKNKVTSKDFLSYEFLLSQSKNYGIDFQKNAYIFGNTANEFGLLVELSDSSKIMTGINRLKIAYQIKDSTIESRKVFIFKNENLYFYYDKNYAFIYSGKKFTAVFNRIANAKAGSQSKKWKEFLSETLFKKEFCVLTTNTNKLNQFGLNRVLLSVHSDSTHFLIKTGVNRKYPHNLLLKEKGFCFEKNDETSSFLNLHFDISRFRENPDDEFIRALNSYAQKVAFPTKEFMDAWEGDISFIQGGLTSASETYIETELDEEFNPIEVRKVKFISVPKYSIMLSMNDKKYSFFTLLSQKGILTVDGTGYRFLTSPLLHKKEYKNYTVFNSGDQFPKIVESNENSGVQFWNGKKYEFFIKKVEDRFILGEFKIEFSDVENYLKKF
ncbi:MAG: hypothetical protein FJX84_07085 [Bacteroidetes bacterium]|nr:hypothetical protein [Bacteroidota bacterium]